MLAHEPHPLVAREVDKSSRRGGFVERVGCGPQH